MFGSVLLCVAASLTEPTHSKEYGLDLWTTCLLPKLREAIPLMLASGQDEITPRKACSAAIGHSVGF
jgi:hypothetical protein